MTHRKPGMNPRLFASWRKRSIYRLVVGSRPRAGYGCDRWEETFTGNERGHPENSHRPRQSSFRPHDLTNRGILRGSTRQLSALSVWPLIELMTNQSVTRLEARGRNWNLTSDGTFENPLSTEYKSGKVENLRNQGNVFNEQNTSINPSLSGKQSH